MIEKKEKATSGSTEFERRNMGKRNSAFFKVAGGNFKVDDLVEVISDEDQQRFHNRIKGVYRKQISGQPWNCFDWGYRTFNAMKHLLMSAALYVEAKHMKDKAMDPFVCFGIYYSLFHASFSLACLHPQIEMSKLRKVSHNFLMNEIKSKFVQAKILPSSFVELFEDFRFLRELTSYFAALGGLEASSFELREKYLGEIPTGVYKNLSLSFQLSGLMGQVLWNVQEECRKENKRKCEEFRSNVNEQEKRYGALLEQHLESLIEYPTAYAFQYSKYAVPRFAFDRQDAWTAIRKLGLDQVCPRMLLFYETKTVGTDSFGWIKSDQVQEDFDEFLRGVW